MPQNRSKNFTPLLILLPLLTALIYILPGLYVRAAYPAPRGAEFSPIALLQLYNYDEYGFYLAMARRISNGDIPRIEEPTPGGGVRSAFTPNIAVFSIISLFLRALGRPEPVMPLLDFIFAIIGFAAIYLLALRLLQSRKAAVIAASLAMLPLPAIRMFEIIGLFDYPDIPYRLFIANEFPLMSRTFAPQMTIPLFCVFLIAVAGMISENGATPRRSLLCGGLASALTYLYFPSGIIAFVIISKCFIYSAVKKRRSHALWLAASLASGIALSIPYIINYMALAGFRFSTDLGKISGFESFDRFAAMHILALVFFAFAYMAFFVPALKKTARILALAMIPAGIFILVFYFSKKFMYFMTPAFYLLLAASLNRNKAGTMLFLIFSSCLEPSLFLRFFTGEAHADVYYFYQNHFLVLAPVLLTGAAYTWISETSPEKPAPRRIPAAVFPAALVLIFALGAASAVSIASAWHNNYFIPKAKVEALAWLNKNASPRATVVSLDTTTNSLISLKTNCRPWLPRASMTSLTIDQAYARLSTSTGFLGADLSSLEWKDWKGLGFYLFAFWVYSHEFKAQLAKDILKPSVVKPGSNPPAADFLWFGPEEKSLASADPSRFPSLKKVHDNGSVAIYAVLHKSP